MLLTDDRLVAAMRTFVTATNKLQHLGAQDSVDLDLVGRAEAEHREAASLLQDALVERGWRRPSY